MANPTKLPSGRWRIRATINGKRVSMTADTKAEATKMFYEAKREGNVDDRSFDAAMLAYIESKTNILSPATIRGYKVIRRNYITDKLKKARISDVDLLDLQQCINDVAKKHSSKTAKNVKGLITATMKMFRPNFNVALNTPPKIKKDIFIPNDEEVKLMLKQARGTAMEIPILLAAFGGMRRSEICALMPDCVFQDHVVIKRSMVMDENNNWVIKECPKTYAGYREVPLPPDIMKKVLLARHPGKTIVDIHPNALYNRYRHILKMAGIRPYRFHALRHYFASFSHKIGIPDQYIMQIGGWSDVGTLHHIYQHTMSDGMRDTANQIKEYYSNVVNE